VDEKEPLTPHNPELALRLLEAFVSLPHSARSLPRARKHFQAWCVANGAEFPSERICQMWFNQGLQISGKPYLERPFVEIALAFDRHELSMADLFYRDNYGAAMAETTAVRWLALTEKLLASKEYMEAIKKDPKVHALIGEKATDALSLLKPRAGKAETKTRDQIATETLQAAIELLDAAPELVLAKVSDATRAKILAVLQVPA
jgi:hypothetical protein